MTIIRSTTTTAWRRLTSVLATALLIVAAVGTAHSAEATAAKPTVVLVHGAFADASGWSAEIAALQERGYPTLAPPNPLRGLRSDAAYLRSVLVTVKGPIILVGHSYGGAVITNAARGLHNVRALVYVAAFVPAKGESTGGILDPARYPGSLLTPANLVLRPVINPEAPGGKDVDVSISPAAFRSVFAGDLPASRAAVMAASQRPLSLFANMQPSGAAAWGSIPSWDLVTLQDRAIPPAGQLFMARRAGAHIERVRSAHDVMVSHPSAVLKVILDAARHTA